LTELTVFRGVFPTPSVNRPQVAGRAKIDGDGLHDSLLLEEQKANQDHYACWAM
jgi:hypothetical protein